MVKLVNTPCRYTLPSANVAGAVAFGGSTPCAGAV
jgi:hypothetical protein